jgi:hypothetical protein
VHEERRHCIYDLSRAKRTDSPHHLFYCTI